MRDDNHYNYTLKCTYTIPITPEQHAAYLAEQERQKAAQAARVERWRAYADQHRRPELIHELIDLWHGGDTEDNHHRADTIILLLLADDTVSEIFNNMEKWYS
jgi:hypothetical protein